MPKFYYPQFLSDANQYAQAEAFWQQKWEEVVRKAGQTHRWRWPWIRNPLRDGNPIFSAIDEERKLAVRIIQEEPSAADDVPLDWWVDTFGEDTDPDAIRELVIACILSDQTAVRLNDLLSSWITKGEVTTPDYGNPISYTVEPTKDGFQRTVPEGQ